MTQRLQLERIPALCDNYIWLIHDGQAAMVVDPGESQPVLDALQRLSLRLSHILLTHAHADHIGGVAGLQAVYPDCVVHGSVLDELPVVNAPLMGDETLHLAAPQITVDVMAVPGHLRGHLAFYLANLEGVAALFCGDTVFGLGCGRLFDGTAEQMHASLSWISKLPETTRLYCAHEYTAMNLPFALRVDPDNPDLQARAQRIQAAREAGEATVPLTLGEELATNPFFRCTTPAIIQATNTQGMNPVQTFRVLREMRNNA